MTKDKPEEKPFPLWLGWLVWLLGVTLFMVLPIIWPWFALIWAVPFIWYIVAHGIMR